ncbi:hypothetical protein ACQP00_15160 [Dactylosporangium sp. CS-047395]|uniref:hypothetical protein n=1 Tax=Dactylosporangium sp. CS-047395 TaxID=3239936 RepID=UPI003D8C13CA
MQLPAAAGARCHLRSDSLLSAGRVQAGDHLLTPTDDAELPDGGSHVDFGGGSHALFARSYDGAATM